MCRMPRRERERGRDRRSSSSSGERDRTGRRGDDRRGRSRSRSASGLRRSVSRDLYRDDGELPVQKIAKLVNNQQDFLVDLLSEHKAEVESKLQSRSRRFASRAIERQFEVNTGFRELATKAQVALAVGDQQRWDEFLNQLTDQLQRHEEDLIIADTSQHGWLAVSKLRTGQELPKAIQKKLARIEKELDQRRRDGGARKKFSPVPGPSKEYSQRRGPKRQSPEEAMFAAANQRRDGTCSHCQEAYHFYRECPAYWRKVIESRAAKAKADAAAGAN